MKKIAIIFSLLFVKLGAVEFCNKPDANGERAMVIVTASYNNKEWYQRNLDNIFEQEYSNYRLIYIDDCSTDGTADLVQAYVKEKKQEHRVTLIRNTERKLALHNLYNAITSCADHEIVAIVDGDDFLAHQCVLKKLNETYEDNNIWLAYSQFVMWPSGQVGWGQRYDDSIIKENRFRYYHHTPTHLRSFYAWLFKKIEKYDLMYDGDFLKMTYDMAMMLPMVEMARNGHFKFIPKILYIYNDANQISDHRVNKNLQRQMDEYIRSKRRYDAL
jgi:glycosyltransferase involved in cell wall biosynthesis